MAHLGVVGASTHDASGVRVGLKYPLSCNAPIAQLAEAADLKSAKCRFESDWGHRIYTFTQETMDWADTPDVRDCHTWRRETPTPTGRCWRSPAVCGCSPGNHDADRKFDYGTGAERAMELVMVERWTVASMKSDWTAVLA